MNSIILFDLAKKFRIAIEGAPSHILPVGLQSFPRGACGDTSLLLGAYLKDCGFSGFKYVCGERGIRSEKTWHSHAWLQHEKLVIDITADQFIDAPAPIIVLEPSPWHELFEIESINESDFRLWSGYGAEVLHPVYRYLRCTLHESQS